MKMQYDNILLADLKVRLYCTKYKVQPIRHDEKIIFHGFFLHRERKS